MSENNGAGLLQLQNDQLRRMIDSYLADNQALIESQDFARHDMLDALSALSDVTRSLIFGDADAAYHTVNRAASKIRRAIDRLPQVDDVPF